MTKVAKTNKDSHSIFNLIRDGLELSQQIETNLSMLSSSRQKELKESSNTFEPKEVYSIAIDLLEILAYTHNLNIIHRDLKPEKILLNVKMSLFKKKN